MTTPVAKPVKSSPRTQGKKATDFTGLSTERLNEAKKAQQQETAERMAMATAQQEVQRNATIDFQTGEPVDEVETRAVEVNSPTRTIRVNSDITQMTWGREVWDEGDPATGKPAIMGPLKTYTFLEGQPYTNVPVELAMHLNNLGYLSYLGD